MVSLLTSEAIRRFGRWSRSIACWKLAKRGPKTKRRAPEGPQCQEDEQRAEVSCRRAAQQSARYEQDKDSHPRLQDCAGDQHGPPPVVARRAPGSRKRPAAVPG